MNNQISLLILKEKFQGQYFKIFYFFLTKYLKYKIHLYLYSINK